MKILHAIQSMSPADGGPPQSVRNLVRAYKEIKVDAAILCQDAPDAEFLTDLNVPVYALGKRTNGFGYNRALRPWLRANLAQFDAVVIEGLWSYMSLIVPREAQRKRIPYGVFTHGALDPWFNQRYPLKKLKKQIFWRWQYPALREARALLFTGEIERDLAATSFQPSQWQAEVVPFGIMDPEGDPVQQREAWALQAPALFAADGVRDGVRDSVRDSVKDAVKVGSKADSKIGQVHRYLLFLGRIHEKKGCDMLLSAFITVAQQFPDLHLVIAGPDSGGLEARLQQQARLAGLSARVHWPGMLLGDAKWGAIRNCDAFVLPSHQENFGIAVVEALACARPVLISDQVNLWPGVKADGAGLIERDTAEGTVQLLTRWLEMSSAEQQNYRSRAEQCYRDRYSTIETARSLVNLFS